ncbi:hypothetical protein [Pedobacter xixiisoli]|uniref:Uncharacterized protein n=1 Tax=Pedobacter xixiisoli TaxID=1476464 RepID=A0A286AD22_9SPHI|nr:hypothetical protein [Pedobacter xixiisoli]SOD19804.1 hypothetical protein SAMN06297358_3510 [Pedobacter xixiisoli]
MHFPTEVAVILVFLLLANLFPYKPKQTFFGGNFKVLQKEYAIWEALAIVPFFIFMAAIIYSFGSFFLWMNSSPEKSEDLIFSIVPNLYMWFVPATFLAFAVIIFPMTAIYRLILRDRYDEYLHYTNLKHGFDGMRIYRPIAWIFGLASIVSLFLMSDYKIEITEKQIVLNDFLTTEKKSYAFRQIKNIYYVENTISKDQKKISPYPHYYVKFIDGNYWNTMSSLNDDDQQNQIMKYLAQKSKNTIDTVSYIAD